MHRSTLIATFLLGCWTSQSSAQVALAPSTPRPNIAVSGTAEIRVVPDEVNLRLAVESRDPKLDEAVKQNESRIAAVLKFLKDSGIESKDVQTDYVEIHPKFDREPQINPEFYLVRRNVGVRLRKVGQFDEILSGVLRNGVNYVLGVEFRTTELRKHRDAARQQAIRAAKEKAVALAKELDVSVGKAQSIQEQTSGGVWGWSGFSHHWNYANAMSQNVMQSAPAAVDGGESNLAVGMINVTATVNVTFALD
jgi:uncharacterized protein YggE